MKHCLSFVAFAIPAALAHADVTTIESVKDNTLYEHPSDDLLGSLLADSQLSFRIDRFTLLWPGIELDLRDIDGTAMRALD